MTAVLMPLFLAAFAALSASAQSVPVLPPPEWPDEIPGEGTLKKQPVVGVRMGELFVRFEETTLHEVLQRARVGAIGERGEGGSHLWFICFTDILATPPVRVWLTSSVMGNPDQRVVGLNAVAMPRGSAATEGCPELPRILRPISLDRGILIGSSKAHLVQKVGPSSATVDGWDLFNFFGRSSGVMSVVGVRLANDRISALLAHRVTSN